MDYLQRMNLRRTRIENRIIKTYGIYPWVIDVSSADGTGADDFKTLYNSNDPDFRAALWNGISPNTNIDEIVKEKFTEEELQFIAERLEAFKTPPMEYYNCNRAIWTGRLILIPAYDPRILKEYRRHLKEEGDFTVFTGLKLTKKNLEIFDLRRSYCFAVFETETGRMVGMVGLHSYDEERRTAKTEWYIYKPFRNMGYGKEAMSSLARQAFDGKLFEWREKLMKNTYKRHFAKIDLIRAEICASNVSSQSLARACGFKVSYVDRRHFVVEGEGVEDGVIMELEPGDLILW